MACAQPWLEGVTPASAARPLRIGSVMMERRAHSILLGCRHGDQSYSRPNQSDSPRRWGFPEAPRPIGSQFTEKVLFRFPLWEGRL